MAFADPQTVTIDGVAQVLPRTGFSATNGIFTKADGNIRLDISHNQGSRIRDLVKVSTKKVVADPLVPSQNIAVEYSAHIVVDRPRNGVTVDEAAKQAAGLTAWATVANLTKVLSGES